jgi:hypothetical protein
MPCFIRYTSPGQAKPSATRVLAEAARQLTDAEFDKLVNEIGVDRVFKSIDRLTGQNSAA